MIWLPKRNLILPSRARQRGFIINPYRFLSLPGAHRYWRIYITATQGGGSIAAVCELGMYSAKFGANLCTGGSASADSTYSGFYPASNAFNGGLQDSRDNTSNTSLWASSTDALPHWLRYDFGAGNSKEIISLGVHARYSTDIGNMPSAFKVQYSDDASTWYDAWTESGLSWSGFEFKRFYHPLCPSPGYSGSPHGSHSYWRLFVKTAQSLHVAPAVAELEFRATPGGSDQCSGGTPSASSQYSGSYIPSYAFDNNNSTLWSAASSAEYGWVQYAFASPVSVAELSIRSRSDTAASTSPGYFAVQYADSGSGPWTTAWNVQNETGWTLGETRTYTDPNYV